MIKWLIISLSFFNTLEAWSSDTLTWLKKDHTGYDIYFTRDDEKTATQIENYLRNGSQEIFSFFHTGFKKDFNVYIFPDRNSLDGQWSHDWKIPGFKSECWMIASGVSHRLDLLTPRVWNAQACDHRGDDSIEVQQVITHEMVHIFHAQNNREGSFDSMDALSWLVEGLATYASGQLTQKKRDEVRSHLDAGNKPSSLAGIWSGRFRYQQAGSLVRFIDLKYGREKLFSLLEATRIENILETLNIGEKELLEGWMTSLTSNPFRMPAEWEKHAAVWVGWELFAPFNQPSLDVIKALLPFVPVKIVADTKFSAQAAREYLHLQGIDSARPTFYIMPDNRIWLRDHGASFLLNDKKELGYADFDWTHYGIRDWLEWNTVNKGTVDAAYRQILKKTGEIDSLMGSVESAVRSSTPVSMEGGSIEVNGKGVLILCEAVTLQRNPGKSKAFLETEFRRVLGVTKIIWMKQGLADDPHIIRPITGRYIGFGTGGHTDEFVRFADEHTVMLAWVDESEKDLHPINRLNYERMKVNLEILESSTDQDGKPFRIIKVPLPDPITKKVIITNYQKHESDDAVMANWLSRDAGFKAGDTVSRVAAASYLNYFVTNGLVLLPAYSRHGSSTAKEERVIKLFAEAFPGRQLVLLDVLSLNYEGGGIHCITQQQPQSSGKGN